MMTSCVHTNEQKHKYSSFPFHFLYIYIFFLVALVVTLNKTLWGKPLITICNFSPFYFLLIVLQETTY